MIPTTFLCNVYEAETTKEALQQFAKENNMYFVPKKYEVINKVDQVGVISLEDEIEWTERAFFNDITYKRRSLDKLYVYTSDILSVFGLVMIAGIGRMK